MNMIVIIINETVESHLIVKEIVLVHILEHYQNQSHNSKIMNIRQLIHVNLILIY